MTNNNLLLGKLAEVDTKPQLEIYADDVKCSHGATIGVLDDEQMFYLQSRGIRQQEARHMILTRLPQLTEAIHDSALKQQVLRESASDRLEARMTFPAEKYGRIFPYCSVKLTGSAAAIRQRSQRSKPNQVLPHAESAFYRHGYAAAMEVSIR